MAFSDDFNRADSTTTLGTPWIAQAGTWGISSNQAYCSALANDTQETAVVDTVSADGSVSVTIPEHGSNAGLPGGPGHGAGLCFRSVDNNNYLLFDAVGPNSNDPTVYKRVAGVFTLLASVVSAWTNGDSYEVVLSGSSITVKRNGAVLIAAFTDTTHQTATKHGLRITNDITVRFDDFSCPTLIGGWQVGSVAL